MLKPIRSLRTTCVRRQKSQKGGVKSRWLHADCCVCGSAASTALMHLASPVVTNTLTVLRRVLTLLRRVLTTQAAAVKAAALLGKSGGDAEQRMAEAPEGHVWVAVTAVDGSAAAYCVRMQALCTLLPVLAKAGQPGHELMATPAGTGRVTPLRVALKSQNSAAKWGRARAVEAEGAGGYRRGSGWALLGDLLQAAATWTHSLAPSEEARAEADEGERPPTARSVKVDGGATGPAQYQYSRQPTRGRRRR